MKLIYKILLTLGIFFLLSSFTTKDSFAQKTQYPISQLGNCRDAQECFYYCEIPRNAPTCWSYGKYVLHKDVLADTTKSPEQIAKEHGITFPITELGNCNSPQECMQYCNKPENQQACIDFGHKKGLIQENTNNQEELNEAKVLSDAKTQLGCNNKDACMVFCNDPINQQKCQQFAQSEGLNQNQTGQQNVPQHSIPPVVFQATKKELGCDSETTCMDYCNNPDHYQKCQQFAQEHNLIQQQNNQREQQQINQSHALPSGVPTPPCSDQASCMQWCKDNPDQCKLMQQHSQQYNLNQSNGNDNVNPQTISPYPSYQPSDGTYPQASQRNYSLQPTPFINPGGCTTDQDCYQYCQSHIDKCPGFQQSNQTQPTQPVFVNPQPQSASQSNPQTQQQVQPSNNQPPQNPLSTTADQQKMCSQTSGCTWTGSTCNCSSGH